MRLKRHPTDDVMLGGRLFYFNSSPSGAVLYYFGIVPDPVSLHNATNEALPEASSPEAVRHLCKTTSQPSGSCECYSDTILMADVVGC